MTPRGVLVAIVGAAALAAGVAARSAGLLLLATAAGAVLAAGIADVVSKRASNLARLRVAVPTEPVLVGQDAAVTVSVPVAGRGVPARLYVEAVLRRDDGVTGVPLDDDRRRVVSLLRRSALQAVAGAGCAPVATVGVRVPTTRRGMVHLMPPRLWRTDALGLLARVRGNGPSGTVAVCPSAALDDVPGWVRGDTEAGWLAGPEPDDEGRGAMRPYAPGDRISLVHWPTSARRGRRMVREVGVAGPRPLTVFVDIREPVHAADGLEAVVSLAAGVGIAALSAGRRVALGVLGDQGPRVDAVASDPGTLLGRLAIVERVPSGGGIGAPAPTSVDAGDAGDTALVTWSEENRTPVVLHASPATTALAVVR